MRLWPASRRMGAVLGTVSVLGVSGVYVAATRTALPDVPTSLVSRGDYVDIVEARGDVRALRSIPITAPYQAGELQILKLAANGSSVKKGDVVAELDAITMQRTIQDKQSELRQALAEADQSEAQNKLTQDKTVTSLMTAHHDVDRARLDTHAEDLVSKSEAERARLALADTEQKLTEAETRDRAGRNTVEADAAMRQRKIAKIRADIARAQASVDALKLTAPADGTVSLLYNYRNSSPMGSAQEFRPGDRIWAGSQIMELPDLSSVRLASRIDETDRGQLKVGQTATIRVDAVPDREYQATVADLSVLARIDYTTGWPPSKNFDLMLDIRDPDARLRPGMSAAARIAVGRLPDVLLVPTAAVFTVGGQPVVYRLAGRQFVKVPVEVVRRGKDQIVLKDGVAPGDRVALVRPDEPLAKARKGGST